MLLFANQFRLTESNHRYGCQRPTLLCQRQHKWSASPVEFEFPPIVLDLSHVLRFPCIGIMQRRISHSYH